MYVIIEKAAYYAINYFFLIFKMLTTALYWDAMIQNLVEGMWTFCQVDDFSVRCNIGGPACYNTWFRQGEFG